MILNFERCFGILEVCSNGIEKEFWNLKNSFGILEVCSNGDKLILKFGK